MSSKCSSVRSARQDVECSSRFARLELVRELDPLPSPPTRSSADWPRRMASRPTSSRVASSTDHRDAVEENASASRTVMSSTAAMLIPFYAVERLAL